MRKSLTTSALPILCMVMYRRVTGSGVVQMAIGFGVPLVTTLNWLFSGLEVPRCYRVVRPGDSAALADAACDVISLADRQVDSGNILAASRGFLMDAAGFGS